MQNHGITHVEWATKDLGALREFLAGLFGWEFQPFGDNYFMAFPTGQGGVSVGLLQSDQSQPGGTPNVYIKVASIDACLERAQELGAGVAVPKTVIPGSGGFAFLKSPDGNLIGLHELAG
jgi:predicted enzyme related to lactoylglutathione lyase